MVKGKLLIKSLYHEDAGIIP